MKRKHNKKLIEIHCDGCNVLFQKPLTEYKRNISKSFRNFCSRKCCGKHNHEHLDKFEKYQISKYSTNRSSIYSPFKYYLKLIKQRFKDYDVTLEDLKQQWEKQNGKCIYSGIDLELSKHNKIIKNPITSASLDRIDSSKGYIKGNIQFVSRSINYMKGEMSHEETIHLCKLIANFYNNH